jgi:hypothetical protein
VYGSACDPLRMADYRAALRARAECVRDPACDSKVRALPQRRRSRGATLRRCGPGLLPKGLLAFLGATAAF